jgi:hypothetical protein
MSVSAKNGLLRAAEQHSLSHENVLQPGSYNTTSLIHMSSENVFTLALKKVAGFGNDTLGDNSLVNVMIFHSTNICRK